MNHNETYYLLYIWHEYSGHISDPGSQWMPPNIHYSTLELKEAVQKYKKLGYKIKVIKIVSQELDPDTLEFMTIDILRLGTKR